ncbi:MAG: hypothetical protein UT34_C0001G0504 [candidate division WS6 bacterium GW2011_GWF2_39_15]|uniref:Uncharacterized protein n=1 Tax=candidate division WS6 bacterium GW2011_GWF2_39_15 TaxID=1619100 RepID=A0A0G0MTG9_9BACT|nr:MAG: hypothetical protein UT34_C0001G0504 [candidate division WS6 bacterium GW2011_GWF2_39_15]
MNKTLKLVILVLATLVVFGGAFLYLSRDSKEPPKEEGKKTEDITEPIQEKPVNKLCDWVDDSDIIIKINFAEGVEKENSYEAGFYFSPIISTMRVARKECDYRTGFSFTELKGKTAADVGVRNYSDNTRRKLIGEPIDVNFDSNGVPNIGTSIEVTIAN